MCRRRCGWHSFLLLILVCGGDFSWRLLLLLPSFSFSIVIWWFCSFPLTTIIFADIFPVILSLAVVIFHVFVWPILAFLVLCFWLRWSCGDVCWDVFRAGRRSGGGFFGILIAIVDVFGGNIGGQCRWIMGRSVLVWLSSGCSALILFYLIKESRCSGCCILMVKHIEWCINLISRNCRSLRFLLFWVLPRVCWWWVRGRVRRPWVRECRLCILCFWTVCCVGSWWVVRTLRMMNNLYVLFVVISAKAKPIQNSRWL